MRFKLLRSFLLFAEKTQTKITLFFSQVLHSKTTKQLELQTKKVFFWSQQLLQPVNIQRRNPQRKRNKGEKIKSLVVWSSLGRDRRELRKQSDKKEHNVNRSLRSQFQLKHSTCKGLQKVLYLELPLCKFCFTSTFINAWTAMWSCYFRFFYRT